MNTELYKCAKTWQECSSARKHGKNSVNTAAQSAAWVKGRILLPLGSREAMQGQLSGLAGTEMGQIGCEVNPGMWWDLSNAFASQFCLVIFYRRKAPKTHAKTESPHELSVFRQRHQWLTSRNPSRDVLIPSAFISVKYLNDLRVRLY